MRIPKSVTVSDSGTQHIVWSDETQDASDTLEPDKANDTEITSEPLETRQGLADSFVSFTCKMAGRDLNYAETLLTWIFFLAIVSFAIMVNS